MMFQPKRVVKSEHKLRTRWMERRGVSRNLAGRDAVFHDGLMSNADVVARWSDSPPDEHVHERAFPDAE